MGIEVIISDAPTRQHCRVFPFKYSYRGYDYTFGSLTFEGVEWTEDFGDFKKGDRNVKILIDPVGGLIYNIDGPGSPNKSSFFKAIAS